jgi:CRISPR/Cas system type I-B associated protein Csh2 (Cas7 group RAMP superfamily)
MEKAAPAGDPLDDDLRIPVDEYGHGFFSENKIKAKVKVEVKVKAVFLNLDLDLSLLYASMLTIR